MRTRNFFTTLILAIHFPALAVHANPYNGTALGKGRAAAIAISGSNVYVTGGSAGFNSGLDYTTLNYNTTGTNTFWIERYNGPGNGTDRATAIQLYGGYIYVTGESEGAGTGSDYATVKYDSGGNQEWVARYSNSPTFGADKATAIGVMDGDVYVTGTVFGAVLSVLDVA